MFVHGGEFATANQYYHHRDIWRFQLSDNSYGGPTFVPSPPMIACCLRPQLDTDPLYHRPKSALWPPFRALEALLGARMCRVVLAAAITSSRQDLDRFGLGDVWRLLRSSPRIQMVVSAEILNDLFHWRLYNASTSDFASFRFNDLWLFDFQTEKWLCIEFPSTAMIPTPRSGHQMMLVTGTNDLLMYGGYSEVKVPGQPSKCVTRSLAAPEAGSAI
jgi:hypothetical protein